MFLTSVCKSTRIQSPQSSGYLQVRPRRRKTSVYIFHHDLAFFLCNTSCNSTFLYHRRKETGDLSSLTRKKPQSWAWTFSSFLSYPIKPRAEISVSFNKTEVSFWCVVTSWRSLKSWPVSYHWIANVSHVRMQTEILRLRSVSNSEVETETQRRTSGWLCSVSS